MDKYSDNPIILIDDDNDDVELATLAIRSLGYENEIITFSTGQEFIDGLANSTTIPFLIICDVNLPQKNGLEVRRQLTEDERLKFISIPFIFWSTSATNAQIQKAFDLWSQGIFEKPSSVDDLKNLLGAILQYWTLCGHPKQKQR